jgi:hypothetical protein
VPPDAVQVAEYATPTVPGPVAGLHVNASPATAAAAIVPENGTVAEFCGVAESFAVKLKLYGPAAVGVPLIVNVFAVGEEGCNPAGRVPLANEKL